MRKPDKGIHIRDETIILKKKIFDEINKVLLDTGKTIMDLFRRVDTDNSNLVEVDEMKEAFDAMKLNVSRSQISQIFDSIDFDRNEGLSMPELISDFNTTIEKSAESLIAEQRHREALN